MLNVGADNCALIAADRVDTPMRLHQRLDRRFGGLIARMRLAGGVVYAARAWPHEILSIG